MAKYANLRDRVSFPKVLDLPHYQTYGPEHYKHVSGQVIEPRRHWCLLAEIVKVNKGFPLTLTARSRYSQEAFHIVFHTHDLGASFVTHDLKHGCTVAIMYARKHISRWNSMSVLVTDHYSIKLMPLSLDDLLRLNDEVQRWPRSFAKHKSCHNCGKEASLECQRCDILSYCSETCQLNDRKRGHDKYCKIIRDRHFQEMWMLDWQRFRSFLTFPCVANEPDISTALKHKPKQEPDHIDS